MIGSLFAGHEESPGETYEKDGKCYKEYFGQVSEFQKGEKKNVEGKKDVCRVQRTFKGYIDRNGAGSSIRYFLCRRKQAGCDPQCRLCYCEKFNL